MPQAAYEDWLERVRAAEKVGDDIDEVAALTVLVRRWPERAKELDPEAVSAVVGKASRQRGAAELSLALALVDAHWQFKWGIEPSDVWR